MKRIDNFDFKDDCPLSVIPNEIFNEIFSYVFQDLRHLAVASRVCRKFYIIHADFLWNRLYRDYCGIRPKLEKGVGFTLNYLNAIKIVDLGRSKKGFFSRNIWKLSEPQNLELSGVADKADVEAIIIQEKKKKREEIEKKEEVEIKEITVKGVLVKYKFECMLKEDGMVTPCSEPVFFYSLLRIIHVAHSLRKYDCILKPFSAVPNNLNNIVWEKTDFDFEVLARSIPQLKRKEQWSNQHSAFIIYNLLRALKLLHSAHIIEKECLNQNSIEF